MINYPTGKPGKKTENTFLKNPNLAKSRLGTSFEQALNESNQYYLQHNIAIIHKKPTPVQVVKVDFPSRNKARIVEAYYKIPSTTDYNGIYRGKYIDFEAKSCNAGSFPFAHLFKHQIEHLHNVTNHGGIAFLLIEFINKQEVYLLTVDKLISCYEASLNEGRKSIPYAYFKEHGILIKPSYAPRIPYLTAVDQVFFAK
ncbi:MAG: Holliday junction resolvase RecU [Bacilli bacterium]|jgi:recombination protein U|nr:Holliday junction resolvase RecU [Bacilli bacterium]HHU24543.1 Holliday junction resolvase RecU [Acholeplasmataceae bacterium]